MRKRLYIYVNGILCMPGKADHWTDRGVTWTHVHTPYRAEKFEYWSSILTRLLFQDERAATLSKMLSFYNTREWELVLVGHSNGCDVIVKALKLRLAEDPDFYVDKVHLFAPAVFPGGVVPSLCAMLKSEHLYKLILHVGGRDRLLQTMERIGRRVRKIGFDYGAIGGMPTGLLQLEFAGTRTFIDSVHFAGHSTWFERGRNFDRVMESITA